jgi:diguanylate cyclase (GGDEF)-like protein
LNKRISSLFGALILCIVCVAGYFAISDLVGSRSQQQQQSVSPIFGLIESELVEPLHIATTLDKIGVYSEYFEQTVPDEEVLVAQLKDYAERFDLEFYVAHEKSRKQFNSDGRVFDLIEGNVVWYFALKEVNDYPVQAVLGKREDVHLYIDVRQYDEQGEFTGFVGVGKSLDDFIASFEQFKYEYGHEFVFVNRNDEIVLSSDASLLPSSPGAEDSSDVIGIKSISDLPWYKGFADATKDQIEPSLVVSSSKGDLLISQLSIESLNWSIFLITPLSERQQEVSKSFALYIGLGLLFLFALYRGMHRAVDFYADKLSRKFNYDPLTSLANRRYAHLFFTRLRKKHRATAVIMIDLDHFKQVNDNYGHNTGDIVLQSIADLLVKTVRPQDLVVRWGGEEFVIILPNIEPKEAQEIGEECRKCIEKNKISVASSFINTTASLGVSYSRDLSDSLTLMVEWADRAMYQAKQEGKNKVIVKEKE